MVQDANRGQRASGGPLRAVVGHFNAILADSASDEGIPSAEPGPFDPPARAARFAGAGSALARRPHLRAPYATGRTLGARPVGCRRREIATRRPTDDARGNDGFTAHTAVPSAPIRPLTPRKLGHAAHTQPPLLQPSAPKLGDAYSSSESSSSRQSVMPVEKRRVVLWTATRARPMPFSERLARLRLAARYAAEAPLSGSENSAIGSGWLEPYCIAYCDKRKR